MGLATVFDTPHPVALITGSGAPRVGRAIARHLASLGCFVAIHANTSVDEAERAADQIARDHGVQTMVCTGAIDDPSTCERIVRETAESFGRIDVLVNSAAIWSPTPLEAITADDVRRYLEVNCIGSFLCAKAAGLRMVSQPAGGSIINLGDWATTRPYRDHAAYFPSKGAVHAMTRSLAVELGHRNRRVRVNCIDPGPVLLDASVDAATRDALAASTLVGRVGTPQDIAHAVQMLCENTFITGVCLPVDGGRSIYAHDGLQSGRNIG